MRFLGNIIWLICGGLFSGLGWIVTGVLWCISIIGIPYGLQCFKFAKVSFWPFGKEIVYDGGAVSFLVNVIWFLFGGCAMAIGNLLIGCFLCLTIIGIPFGKQFFKLAGLSLRPFGARVVKR
ncbi:MAG: YccF domain-containing protein [Lachnospiraceae bacterium]|nr:YccF domain-containing protein [Lachnospiraceae bacterium]